MEGVSWGSDSPNFDPVFDFFPNVNERDKYLADIEPEDIFEDTEIDGPVLLKDFKPIYLGKHRFLSQPMMVFVERHSDTAVLLKFRFGVVEISAVIAIHYWEKCTIHDVLMWKSSGKPPSNISVADIWERRFISVFKLIFWNTMMEKRNARRAPMAKTTTATTSADTFVEINKVNVPFALSDDSFQQFRKPRADFVYRKVNTICEMGEPAEFLCRVIWFDEEADLWIFKRDWSTGKQEYGFKLIDPKGNDHIIEEFIIPRDSFELAISLNKLGAIEQHATVELLTFIKTCKLADTFMQKNKIG